MFYWSSCFWMANSALYSSLYQKDALSNTLEITWITFRFSCLLLLDEGKVVEYWYKNQNMINYISFLLVTLNIQKGVGYDLLTANIFTYIYQHHIQQYLKKKEMIFFLNSYILFNYWLVSFLFGRTIIFEDRIDTLGNLSIHAFIPFSVMGYIYINYPKLFHIKLNFLNGIKIYWPILTSYLAILSWYKLTLSRSHMIHYKNHNSSEVKFSNQELIDHISHMRNEKSVTPILESIKFNDDNKLTITNQELIKLICRDLGKNVSPTLIITEKDVWTLFELRVYQINNKISRLFDFESVNEFRRLMVISDTDNKDMLEYKSFLNEVYFKYVEQTYSVLPLSYIGYLPMDNTPVLVLYAVSTIIISAVIPVVSNKLLSGVRSYFTNSKEKLAIEMS